MFDFDDFDYNDEKSTFDNTGGFKYEEKRPEQEVLKRDIPNFNETNFAAPPDRKSIKTSPGPQANDYTVPLKSSDGMAGPGGEQAQPTQEDIEKQKIIDVGAEAVALGAARALAGLPQPPKPTQSNVGGYIGTRNVENQDILNSSAAGTARNATGGAVPAAERKGDAFVAAKESHNTSTDTLRPTFGIAPANAVIPSKVDQIQSDILFSDFSVVAPGNGLGVTNKMFQMEEWRDANFVYKEPLAEPRTYQGPTGCVEQPPLQWQNEITRRDRRVLQAQEYAAEATGVVLERRAGEGSLNILGDDYGFPRGISDKGLKRARESPLEPVIITPKQWERVKPLPGFQYARKEPRRLFDAERYPERFNPHVAMEGGPTMSKRNSLATYPFPITSH